MSIIFVDFKVLVECKKVFSLEFKMYVYVLM